MSILHTVIMGMVEGITEFLPISSTAHLAMVQQLLGIAPTPFTETFLVQIQFGAILAVLFSYPKKFVQSRSFYLTLLIAFLPAAVIGALFHNLIESFLSNDLMIAIMLFAGGVAIVLIERYVKNLPDTSTVTHKKALGIGFYQCLAFFPGVSRSGASIMGGILQPLDRKTAAEFSFFLGVPTISAAAGFSFLQHYRLIHVQQIPLLLTGNIVAFITAMAAIKFFIHYLSDHTFTIFGYYRIVAGVLFLLMYYS